MASQFSSAALACAAIGAFAFPSAVTTIPTDKPDKFVLEAGTHEFVDLVEQSARYLGRNYLYSQTDIQNTAETVVRLQHRMELDAKGCEEVVSELAYSIGFAMFPVDEERGIYEWASLHGPKRSLIQSAAVALTPEQVEAKRNLRIPVMVCYTLEHVNPNAATNQLRPFFSKGGRANDTITIGSAARAVLLSGFAPEVAAAIEIIKSIDVAPPAKERAAQSVGDAKGLPTPPSWQAVVEQRLQALEEAPKSLGGSSLFKRRGPRHSRK